MSVGSFDPLFSQALALPEAKRLELAAELLASVRPPDVWGVADPGFVEELERRVRAVETGDEALLEWSEVKGRIEAKLGQIRPDAAS